MRVITGLGCVTVKRDLSQVEMGVTEHHSVVTSGTKWTRKDIDTNKFQRCYHMQTREEEEEEQEFIVCINRTIWTVKTIPTPQLQSTIWYVRESVLSYKFSPMFAVNLNHCRLS